MATELLANPNFELWTDSQELLTDPGFESWISATDLTSWTESSSTSTVNRDTAGKHSGTYCVRMDVDGSNTYVYLIQDVSVTAGVPYTFSFWHKETGTAGCYYTIQKSAGDYLQADGSWAAGSVTFVQANTATYAQATKNFIPYFTDNVVIYIGRYAATSASIYIDDASLQQKDGLLTDGDFNNWTDENELLTNPNFSAWSSGTDATGWTETVAGSSTVKMNGTAYHGNWCALLTIDGSDSNAQIAQGVALTSGKSYTFSFYHKESGAATAKYAITNASADYLQADGTWAAGVVWFETGNEAAYAIESKAFTPDETSSHTLTIKEGSNVTSETIHIDAASLQLTAGLVTDGSMEAWDDANTLTNWTTTTAGGTSILTRSADPNTGTYAASLVIGAGSEDVTIYQDIAVTAGKAYELSFYHKETNAATVKLRLTDLDPAPDDYLQANGTWAAGTYHFTITNAAAYTVHSLKFVAQTTGTLRVEFLGEDASETYYIDDVCLKALPVLTSWTAAPLQFSMVERELTGESGLAVRVVVDANGEDAYVTQSLGTLTSGVAYQLTVYGYADASADPTIQVVNASGDELQADGTWVDDGDMFTWVDTGWTSYTLKFVPDETSAHAVRLYGTVASKSYYYDSISFKPIPTPTSWTAVPGKLSMIERDYDGEDGACARIDCDAAGTAAYAYQAVALVSGSTYLLTAYGKADADADPTLSVYNGSGDELQAVGTWVNNGNVFAWTDTGYTLQTIYLSPDESSNHTLMLTGPTADKSYYYDTMSLTKVDPIDHPNLFKDGKLELWTSPTGLACWTETVAGTSTVNQEDTGADVAEGTYSCRLDIDATPANAQIAQAVSLTSGKSYSLSFQHMADASAQLQYAVTNGSADYLQVDGTWAAGAIWFEPAHSATFVAETKTFVPDETSAHTLTIKNATGSASKSIWIDDIRLNDLTVRHGYTVKPSVPRLNRHPINTGLVGCWSAYEGSGLALHDLTVKHNHGTFGTVNGGNPSWVSSSLGHALHFDDKGYVAMVHDVVHTGDNLSVELIFDVAALPSVLGRSVRLAIKNHGAAYSWLLYIPSTDDKLTAVVINDTVDTYTLSADAALVAGRRYHAVLTVNPTIATLYIDAVAQGDTETPGSVLEGTGTLLLSDDTAGNQHVGHIAKLAIYNRSLGQNEISLLYHDPWVGVHRTRRRRR